MLSRKLVLLGILVTASLGVVVAGCGNNASVTRPTVDEQAIPAPDGVSAAVNVTTGTVSLNWLPVASVPVAGYNVYKFDPSPLRETSYTRLNATPVAQPTFTRDEFALGGDFMVKAVNTAGREGLSSRPIHLNLYDGPPDQLRQP